MDHETQTAIAGKNAWAITGVGLVAAGADTSAGLFDRLLACEQPDPAPAIPIEGFEVRDFIDRRGLKDLSRTSRLAVAAASRLDPGIDGVPAASVGVVFGTAWASLDTVVRFEREAHVEGPRFVDPILFTETVANVPAGQVSIVFGWSAVNTTISSGTASGLEALVQGRAFLEEGRAQVIVAGAADELNEHLLSTLRADRRLPECARPTPHAAGAGGAVGGEGACLLAIESATHAAERGVTALGFLGAGRVCYFDDGGAAAVDRRARIVTDVIESEGLRTDEIDLIVLSGNGDPRRDRVEAAVVGAVFGDAPPPAALPKAVLGETWGASGVLGVAVALEAMARSLVPPAPVEPASESVRVSSSPVSRSIRHALVLDCPEASHFAAQIVLAGG